MSPSFEELQARSQRIRVLRALAGHTEDVRSVTFSPDGQLVASGADDNTVRLWEVKGGRELRTLIGHTGWVWSVAFSPNGQLVASASGDDTVRLWEVEDGRELRTLTGHTMTVNGVAFSPDGRLLASGADDNTVRLWEVKGGRELRSLIGHTGWVWSVAFSPNGQLVASASRDDTVRLWEVEDGRELRTLIGHTLTVRSVTFSPDQRLLASGSYDNTVRLWEVDSGRELRTLTGHTDEVVSVAFSPDGHLLASGSWDGTARLWDISALDVGPKLAQPEPQPIAITTDLHTPLRTHLRTLPLCHVSASNVPPDRAAAWLRGAAAAGWPLPLALARDLGLLLSQPADQLTIAKPAHLPFDEDTSAYLAFLQCVVAHPLVRELPAWRPLPSDAVLAVILARLVEGLDLPGIYRPPTGPAGVLFIRTLARQMAGSEGGLARDPLALREPPPARERVGLDQLDPGAGARFGDWAIWRSEGPYLIFAHRSTSVVIELCEGSRGWFRYRDCDRAEWAVWPWGSRDTLGLYESSQQYLDRPAPAVALSETVRTFGRWRLAFNDGCIEISNARSSRIQILIAPHTPVFRFRNLRREEQLHPPAGGSGAVQYPPPTARPQEQPGVTVPAPEYREPASTDPAQIWRDTPIAARPDWNKLLPPEALARIERNLQALDREELRFLVRYGPPLAGSPDPRDLLDMLSLTGLPDVARLALSQTLKLLPRVSAARTVGGVQTYPEGGYEGLARKGSLDSLLLTELAYPEEVFLHRFFNHEALYYGRERPRERRRELAYVVTQTGWGLGGDGEVLARALLLALAQAMRQRGYEVLYSFAGRELSEPGPLGKPGEVGRMLYHREAARVEEEEVLKGVLRHLRGWREVYRGRQVLWVLSEFFDADWWEEHEALYQSLRVEGGQQAWFIRVGQAGRGGNGRRQPPPAARFFESWQVLETGIIWEGQPSGAA